MKSTVSYIIDTSPVGCAYALEMIYKLHPEMEDTPDEDNHLKLRAEGTNYTGWFSSSYGKVNVHLKNKALGLGSSIKKVELKDFQKKGLKFLNYKDEEDYYIL